MRSRRMRMGGGLWNRDGANCEGRLVQELMYLRQVMDVVDGR